MSTILERISSPADVKGLGEGELLQLADEVRQRLISTVSESGGHFASNLGTVELTVALHHLLDLPKDILVWDVSHQVYPHKILTGRNDRMGTIRQYGGLSGFASRAESEYDPFGAGHASTAISAALGFAGARDAQGKDHRVVCVVGDGALTGGLAYEGLNNLGETRKDMLVILNDNTWSISRNVGAISRYLTGIMTDERYNRVRQEVWEFIGRFKRREKIREIAARIEHSLKGLLTPGTLFENLGIRYFGPIDGHDLPLLVKTIREIDQLHGPRLLHIATVKGNGYKPAEADALKYHGVTAFDKVNGKFAPSKPSLPQYTKVFGDALCELGERAKSFHVITAAMPTGAGVAEFGAKFPARYYDVGIAEAHAVCFAAGMAAGGERPVVAVYSTFLQRAYDQIIHDVGVQNLPVVFCMDRAGLVGNDGPTHHGMFDLTYLQAVPNMTICAPRDGNQLRAMMRYAVEEEITGPVAIRYPRAATPVELRAGFEPIEWGMWEELRSGGEMCVLAVGSMVTNTLAAAERILNETGRGITVVDARFIKPLDTATLERLADTHSLLVTIEENVALGGFGSTVATYLDSIGYDGEVTLIALPDRFITQGNMSDLWREVRLDVDAITERLAELLDKNCAEIRAPRTLTLKRQSAPRLAAGAQTGRLTDAS